MKAFFLALVLANVLYFAWSRWHVPADPEAGELPQETPTLALAGDNAPEQAAPARPEPATGGKRCQAIGPFLDLPEASHASVLLRDKGYEPKTRTAEGDIWAGLWVYLPNLPSRAEAQRIMGVLRQHGMNDAYIMPSMSQSIEISLGIYSETQRAQKRADDARRLGFNPTLVEHTRKGTVYWLDVDLKSADPGVVLADLQDTNENGAGRIVRLEIKACPAPSGGSD